MWFKKKPSTPTSKSRGQQKEQQACDWLQAQGFQLIEQNYHCKGGEIDIIMLSPLTPQQSTKQNTEQTLIFIEVKYRKNNDHGHPAEFVTPQKQHKIRRCAQTFLLNYPKFDHLPMRFDVITYQGTQTTPNWIQNAF